MRHGGVGKGSSLVQTDLQHKKSCGNSIRRQKHEK